MFKLHYHCENTGDGSVNVVFHETAKEAESADEALEEGWGDSSASSITLKVQKGKIVRRVDEWNPYKLLYEIKWLPLEEVK